MPLPAAREAFDVARRHKTQSTAEREVLALPERMDRHRREVRRLAWGASAAGSRSRSTADAVSLGVGAKSALLHSRLSTWSGQRRSPDALLAQRLACPRAPMTMSLAIAAFALAPGLAIGSFLNVVVARVPLRRSIVSPGSACMSCSTRARVVRQHPARLVARAARPLPLMWRVDPVRYPAVELVTALLVAGCFWKFGLSGSRLRRRLLLHRARGRLRRRTSSTRSFPNRIVLPPPPSSWPRTRRFIRARQWALGALGASGFLFAAALAYPKGMGMGDVKLALLMGAALGRTVPVALMLGMLARSCPALPARTPRQRRQEDADPVRAVPRARLRRRPVLGPCDPRGVLEHRALIVPRVAEVARKAASFEGFERHRTPRPANGPGLSL